jgi:hypothetical protein
MTDRRTPSTPERIHCEVARKADSSRRYTLKFPGTPRPSPRPASRT